MKTTIGELRTLARTNPIYAEALRKLESKEEVKTTAQDSVSCSGKAPSNRFEPENGQSCAKQPPREKKPRQSKQPNRTEQRFLDICEARKRHGEIKEVRFEGITIKLADGCRYTPDVMTIDHENRIVFYEVKGSHIWDDSKVKFRVAKDQNPWATFEMHQWKSGEWTRIL